MFVLDSSNSDTGLEVMLIVVGGWKGFSLGMKFGVKSSRSKFLT